MARAIAAVASAGHRPALNVERPRPIEPRWSGTF
jgi:hypothetical protein